MESEYLIDSNAVVDFLMYRMPPSEISFLYEVSPEIPIITRIELFCKAELGVGELDKLNQFISIARIYQIDEVIALRAIDIRLKYKLKLPDAIIAATAQQHALTLVTRNVSDFDKIEGLEIINPHTI